MKQNNRQTGNRGEAVACELLQRKGYEILTRNYGNKWGEVDIIAKLNQNTIKPFEEYRVFVEVKTKRGGEYGEPWEMINNHKLHQVQNMGHLWCEEYGWKGLCRIDVVGVWMDIDGEIERVEHWENVQM
jgi:putative endonuclease